MELLLKRDQDQGMLGGIKFILEAKAILTTEEKEIIKKYKAHKYILFNSEEKNHLGGIISIDPISYNINDLMYGIKDKVKDVSILLNKEQVLIEACKNLKTALDIMKSFGGEERLFFKKDGVYDSHGNKIE